MAGTSNFPASLDSFPEIGPGTSENDPAARHDVVHENVHAALLALQEKVGIDESADEASIDFRLAAAEEALDDLAGDVAGKAAATHTHDASDITSGAFNAARIAGGTATAGYVPKSNGDGTVTWGAESGGGGSGGVVEIIPGTGISVDATDPTKPVVSATGGGGGGDDTLTWLGL